MKTSDRGIELLKKIEDFRAEAYRDPASPDGLPITIGYGRAHGVSLGDTCTPEQAEEWLREDLEAAEHCINTHVKVPLSQHEFDALASFVYNLGCHDLATSTLLKNLNAGDRKGAAQEFHRWVYSHHRIVSGLVNRRQREADVFKYGY